MPADTINVQITRHAAEAVLREYNNHTRGPHTMSLFIEIRDGLAELRRLEDQCYCPTCGKLGERYEMGDD